MAALLDFARAHDLWLICDEAYEALTYTDCFVSAAALDHRDRLIGVYSFSKSYAMTGWRIGYMVVPRAIAPVFADLQEAMISCASTPGQWAALAALEGPQDVVAENARGLFGAPPTGARCAQPIWRHRAPAGWRVLSLDRYSRRRRAEPGVRQYPA